MHYTEDDRYAFGNKVSELDHVTSISKNDVEFYQTTSSDGPDKFQFHLIKSTGALRALHVDEELYWTTKIFEILIIMLLHWIGRKNRCLMKFDAMNALGS